VPLQEDFLKFVSTMLWIYPVAAFVLGIIAWTFVMANDRTILDFVVYFFSFLGFCACLAGFFHSFYYRFILWRVAVPEGWQSPYYGFIYTGTFTVPPDDYRVYPPVMYPTTLLMLRRTFRNVITRDGVALKYDVELTLSVFDSLKLSNCDYHIDEAIVATFEGSFRNKIRTIRYGDSGSELQSAKFLDNIILPQLLQKAKTFAKERGVDLMNIYVHNPKLESKQAPGIMLKGDEIMNSITPANNHNALEVLQHQYNIMLPSFFDFDQIKSDMQKIDDGGLLSTYVFALTRKFRSSQQRKLIEEFELKCRQLLSVMEAVQGIRESEVRHTVNLARQNAQYQKHKADYQRERAREMRAKAKEVSAEIAIKKKLNPPPKAKPKRSNVFMETVAQVITGHADAMQAHKRIDAANSIGEDEKKRLHELMDKLLMERINRKHL